jgi:hypothetical protein
MNPSARVTLDYVDEDSISVHFSQHGSTWFIGTVENLEELFLLLLSPIWSGIDVTNPILPEPLPYSFADKVAAEYRQRNNVPLLRRRRWKAAA